MKGWSSVLHTAVHIPWALHLPKTKPAAHTVSPNWQLLLFPSSAQNVRPVQTNILEMVHCYGVENIPAKPTEGDKREGERREADVHTKLRVKRTGWETRTG